MEVAAEVIVVLMALNKIARMVIFLTKAKTQFRRVFYFFLNPDKTIEARTFCVVSLEPKLLLLSFVLMSHLPTFGDQEWPNFLNLAQTKNGKLVSPRPSRVKNCVNKNISLIWTLK